MNPTTRIACLTPPGRAAIAVLAVRGPRAWEVTRSLFQPGRAPLPDAPELGRSWFGRLGDELRDEIVLVAKQVDDIELQCHGGPEVVRLLQETYARHGIEACDWKDLEQLVPESPWQQQILEWLVQAPTVRTAAILLDQYHGAFARAMAAIQTGDMVGLHRLAQLIPLGQHLVHPWRIVVCGAPNVGKSSLVNALAGYTRCLVSPMPGTTRDVVTTTLAIDGWPIELIDTAGLREADHALERAGIARAHETIASADVRLWIVDGSAPAVMPDDATNTLLIINKVDLPPAWDWESIPALRVSAQRETGLEALCQELSQRLVPQPPSAGEAVPVTPEACELIRQALAHYR
jgi:tRNA modification GTPase